jgi:tRNA threonylcarbamoyladenosine biosynthesis protein TsaB
MKLNGDVLQKTNAMIIDENSFADLLKSNKMLFFGDGASKCKPILQHRQNAMFVDNIYPSAVQIGEMAWHKYTMNLFEDLAYFEPFYLKDFIAKKPSSKKLVS